MSEEGPGYLDPYTLWMKYEAEKERCRVWRESYQRLVAAIGKELDRSEVFEEDFGRVYESARVFDGAKGKVWEP